MNLPADAVSKLENLSEERARKVMSLIDDLSELEALENRADLLTARAALAEVGADAPWEQVKKELDAKFDYPAPGSEEVSR